MRVHQLSPFRAQQNKLIARSPEQEVVNMMYCRNKCLSTARQLKYN